MTEKRIMRLSSRGRRLGAFVIDEAIPFVLSIIAFVQVIRLYETVSYYNGYSMYGIENGTAYNQITDYSTQSAIGVLICFILSIAYLVVQIVFYTKSQSIGKAILHMKVVNNKTGEPIGVWWMLLREVIVKDASMLCFGLGFIWILIDNKNRSWHDKILDTYVVDVDKPVPVVASVTAPIEEKATEIDEEPVTESVAEPIVETLEEPSEEHVLIEDNVMKED